MSFFYHCYATANDDRYFINDIENFRRMAEFNHGVENVNLVMAISLVKSKRFTDVIFVKAVKRFFKKHPTILLTDIFFKPNRGRDFSSYHEMLKRIVGRAEGNDYIFFQNRSGYGPFQSNWATLFIEQFNRFEKTAIAGVTINFNDHPDRSLRSDLPHVQTYAFLSDLNTFAQLLEEFPGRNETERLQIILNGEIELSQIFINSGMGISCLEWPNQFITNETPCMNSDDIKNKTNLKHPFRHRQSFLYKKVDKLRARINFVKFVLLGK